MSIIDEVRHLDGIKGNFMISQSEYCAPLILYRKVEHYETRLLQDDQEISHKIRELVEYSDELLVCSSFEGMQMIYDSFLISIKRC
jgi:hypothetical protein